MMNSNDTKLLRKFLKERGLTKTFNRSKKIKRKTKANINIDGTLIKVIVHKSKGKTVIRDFNSLNILATTTKYNTRNFKKGLQLKTREVKRKTKKGKTIIETIISRDIKLKELFTEIKANVLIKHKQTPLRTKFGKIFMSVSFYHKGKLKCIKEGGSQKTRILSRAKERKIAIDEAFKGAVSQINFSFDNFKINWIHYVYYYSRRKH